MNIQDYFAARNLVPTLLKSSHYSNNLISLYAVVDELNLSKIDPELQKSWIHSYTYYIITESEVISGQLSHIYPYLTEEEALELFSQKTQESLKNSK